MARDAGLITPTTLPSRLASLRTFTHVRATAGIQRIESGADAIIVPESNASAAVVLSVWVSSAFAVGAIVVGDSRTADGAGVVDAGVLGAASARGAGANARATINDAVSRSGSRYVYDPKPTSDTSATAAALLNTLALRHAGTERSPHQ